VTARERELYVNRLASCARAGDEVAFAELARALAPMLYSEVGRIDVPGADRDDVGQEALLALYAAVLRYDGERAFGPLATTVVRRALVSMLRAALRGKHRPINDLRLEQRTEEGIELAELIADRGPGPFERVHEREQLRQITAAIGSLSALERRALAGTLEGRPYHDIGPAKAVDNALQRARKRLRKACA
jgi:RNA polymerase sigma factor (sigma-70 family)